MPFYHQLVELLRARPTHSGETAVRRGDRPRWEPEGLHAVCLRVLLPILVVLALLSLLRAEAAPRLRASAPFETTAIVPEDPARIGALVTIDSFPLRGCPPDRVVVRDARHAEVTDACGTVFESEDGGASFASRRSSGEEIPGAISPTVLSDLALHDGLRPPAAFRLTLGSDPYGKPALVLPRRGRVIERIVGRHESPFGLVAWTAHGVLGQVGSDGPLVARARLDAGEGTITYAARPFDDEWFVRTTGGAILQQKGERRLGHGAPLPNSLVTASPLDAWRLRREEALDAGKPLPESPMRAVLDGTGEVRVVVEHAGCSDIREPVTYVVRIRAGAISVAVGDGAPRQLRGGEADSLRLELADAWRATARSYTNGQPMYVDVQDAAGSTSFAVYPYPSPRGTAILRALGDKLTSW